MRKVMYLCDGEKPDCKKTHCYKNTDDCPCRRTLDINHAINFEKTRGGYYREKENRKTLQEEWGEEEKKRSAISKTQNMAEQKSIDLP